MVVKEKWKEKGKISRRFEMNFGKERTVVLKDGTSFVGKKVLNFWEGWFETTYKVTKGTDKFPIGTKIKTAALSVSYVVIHK